MKTQHKDIDKFLPYGELIRGFANQSYLSKSDLKKSLRKRGIFFTNSEKETLVPCISTLLLSPAEFDDLRTCQNTREDNIKKNTSRLEWNSDKSIIDTLTDFSFQNIIPDDGINFWFNSEPSISVLDKNQNTIAIDYEIERHDLNKSWYESKNIFKGRIVVEKVDDNEIKFIKSYTSFESNFVAENIQRSLVQHFKAINIVQEDKELKKILFGDFSKEDRIVFFYRLSSYMQNSIYFTFKDIINMEFKPDDNVPLPKQIDWMENKSALKLKGNQIHDTFFIREKEYHPNLQFWEMESSFDFTYQQHKGSCNVVFSFRDFPTKGNNAEFEINISNFSLENGSDYSTKDKSHIKNDLLDLFEAKKDDTYRNFLKHIESKKESAT